MLTGLFLFYVLFVVIRDGDKVAYKLWSYYHDHVRKPRLKRRGVLIQYASNSVRPQWLRSL